MNRAGKFHAFDLDCMAFTARVFQEAGKRYKRPGWNRSGGAHAATRRYFFIPLSTDRIRVRVSLKISNASLWACPVACGRPTLGWRLGSPMTVEIRGWP